MLRRKDLTSEKPMQVVNLWPDRLTGVVYSDASQALNTITSES